MTMVELLEARFRNGDEDAEVSGNAEFRGF